MYTFQVPIAKLRRTVPVTLSGDDALRFHAQHGLKQRLNDTTASIKRNDYDDEALFVADVEDAVGKVKAKIESDTVGVRATADPQAKQARDLFAKLTEMGVTADELVDALTAMKAAKAA